mgnify:CR=1 FL=1
MNGERERWRWIAGNRRVELGFRGKEVEIVFGGQGYLRETG